MTAFGRLCSSGVSIAMPFMIMPLMVMCVMTMIVTVLAHLTFGHQMHIAFWTVARLSLSDFRMHGTRIYRTLMIGWDSIPFIYFGWLCVVLMFMFRHMIILPEFIKSAKSLPKIRSLATGYHLGR
ncbi:MAG: hypothetical protein ACJAZW_000579 [Maritalea sp.]